MRYQSNGRNSIGSSNSINRARDGGGGTRPDNRTISSSSSSNNNQQQQQQYSQSRSNVRPRAISAGRLRQQQQQQGPPMENHDDPSEVARQILDIRERRESSTRNKQQRQQMMPPGQHSKRPTSIPSHINTQGSGGGGGGGGGGPSSPTGLVLNQVGSGLSQEEIQAEERLKRAENKIGGLLQDLEELKFFQEIEMEQPAPKTPRAPSSGRGVPPRNNNNNNNNSNMNMNNTNNGGGGPPKSIRASSPAQARGGRLPPPPPNKGGGLETYKPMSPRAIAKLDRNSLELECQTIVRKLQILEQERFSHQATIEMYEISLQEHDNDKAKTQRLETELQKVSTELRKQLYNITKGKESLVKEYEDKLQINIKKLHRTQEKADSYKSDLDEAKSNAERFKVDVEKYRGMATQEKRNVNELLSNEETLQLQLLEARNLNATLVKKVEKKRSEVSGLKDHLSNSEKLVQETQREREDAYESRIMVLEQQVSMSKDRYSRLEKECTERNASLVEKDNDLNEAKIKQSEFECNITDMHNQIEALEKHAEIRFEEGKKAGKAQDTRKAQELVAERANSSRESERRIKAMQEQLRHQTDRHHKEIEETRSRNQKRIESMKEDLREEIRTGEGDKVNQLESKMSSLKRSYDEEKLNYSTRLQDAQQKAREAAEEFQQQDQTRQQELDHMNERLNSYFNDFAEKDNQISSLKEKLEEYKQVRETMQKEHSVELEKHEDLLETERAEFLETEAKLKDEISTLKATYSQLENEMTTNIQKLREQVDEGSEKLSNAEALLKENEGFKDNLEKVQAAFDDTKKELTSERARVEDLETELRVEVAKLQGQLRASESALQNKKAQIENLSRELDMATTSSSKDGEEKQNQIIILRKQVEDISTRLESSTSASEAKETKIQELQYESGKLKESLSDMRKFEDDFQDMKRTLAITESEKKNNVDELLEVKSAYESTRSKVLEVEQRYSDAKDEFNKRLETKEKLLMRCDKTINELEFNLEKERSESIVTKRSITDLESEKRSLRKDYEELTALLEENLHSSAKKDELDTMLKNKETELKETVDIYQRQSADLESKMKDQVKANEELRMKNNNIQTSLNKMQDDKNMIFNDLTKVQKNYDNVSRELEEIKDEQHTAIRGMNNNIGKKDNHLREAVQRYTRTIADLETKLEEETQTKLELEDRLSSARSELEDKQKQTQEMVQRHAKATMALESGSGKASSERELLKADLDRTKKDLLKKEVELSELSKNYQEEIASFENVKQDHDVHRDRSQSTRQDLQRKETQMTKMKQSIEELRNELDIKSTESKDLKISFERNEMELKQRKEQINSLVTKYTDQIAELEAKLDEHSMVKSTTEDKVETVQAQASRKDGKIRELMKSIVELEAKLEAASRSKESMKLKSESLFNELDEKESTLRSFEVEKIEMETKLHTQTRSKDELRSKMTELSSRLERKEREVREVSDRYKIYVMELEAKLDQDTDTKHHLQLEIDNLRNNLDTASEVSSEALELRKKVDVLEKTLQNSKEVSGSLQDKLDGVSKSRASIEAALKKAISQKAEVIAALEGVINEVQNREDEIESLSELLQRRDEELQHAKIIATKALQSAKDIQKRYKDKDEGRHSDLMGRMNEVSDNVDRLTTKNESLQRKISSLERELRDRNLECKRLKDQLRQIDGKQMREHNMKDDISAMSTQSTEFTNFSSPPSCHEMGIEVDHLDHRHLEQPISMDSGSFSPTNNVSSGDFTRNVEFPAVEKQYSRDSLDGSNDGARWAQDFETDSRSGFESISSEQRSTKSRRSVERDALRKYVRQRYDAKRGEKPSL
jgi:chromosome segregation ATPase